MEIEFSEKELTEHPLKRIQHLECVLRYFFGETKMIRNLNFYQLQLLDHKQPLSDICPSTSFYEKEICSINYDAYRKHLWKLIFNMEKMINASKKGR